MAMDEERLRAWRALGLGPVWVARSGTAKAPEQSGTGTAPDMGRPPGNASEARVADRPKIIQSAALERQAERNEVSTADWGTLESSVAGCHACDLAQGRTQTVFGVGNRNAEWMFIGEAPGAEEDARGEPFVGQAGRLLDNMLTAIGLSRSENVFIANVLKCRPPRNRDPLPTEVASCEPFLARQIALVDPRIIVVMGRFAAQSLLRTDANISSMRGRVHGFELGGRTVPVVVTYHPAYLLRTPSDKGKTWSDLCLARAIAAQAD
jgi:uracil-DNA glycosylase family 4